MKFNFKFSNLCGSVYRQGNLLFTPDGNSVLSPVGNRISVFDLVNHRCTTLACENRKNISRLALSPNATLLISVDEDGHAIIINYLKKIIVCEFHFQKSVRDLKFSPDSKYIAVTHGDHIQVWKSPPLVTQFRPFVLHRTYTGHYGEVTTLHWTPDSKYFFSGSQDMSVRMYSLNPTAGFVPLVITGHRNHIVSVFFGEPEMDVPTLFTLSKDGSLFAWKYFSSKDALELKEAKDEARAEAEGDEHTNTRKRGRAHAFQASRQTPRLTNSTDKGTMVVAGDSGEVEGKQDSKEEEFLFAGGKWVLDKKHYIDHNHAKIISAEYHKPSGLLVVGLSSGVFTLYELPSFTNIHSLSISQQKINTISINQSGEWLAFGSSTHGQLLVWEWQSETFVLKQQGHFFDLNTLAYSPDGQLIATGGDDGKVKLWNTQSGFCFVTFADHTSPVQRVEFSATGTVVFSCSLDGTVRAYDLVRYRNFRTLTSPKPTQFHSLATDDSGEVVVAGAMDPFEIYVWSLQTGRLLDVLTGHNGPISGLTFSGAHSLLASCSWDKSVKLWDIYNGKGFIESLEHSADVLGVAFRPDGQELCSCALDGQLYFWDHANGVLKGTIAGTKDIMGGRLKDSVRTAQNSTHSYYFTSVCYSADGACIVAGGNCKFVCIYEISQRILLQRFQLSANLSLDGMLSFLNSKHMTDAGNKETIDDEDSASEGENTVDKSLPGAKKGEFSSRQKRVIMRTKCVRFSPTGLQWAAACAEGLLIYSLDDAMHFDPTDLDLDVLPETVYACLERKEFARALAMSLRLNESELIAEVMDQTPHDQISLVVRSVPSTRLQRLLDILCAQLDSSPHVEFYLVWALQILSSAGIKRSSSTLARSFRTLQKMVSRHQQDLAPVCNENLYLLQYLASTPQQRAVAGLKIEDISNETLSDDTTPISLTKHARKRKNEVSTQIKLEDDHPVDKKSVSKSDEDAKMETSSENVKTESETGLKDSSKERVPNAQLTTEQKAKVRSTGARKPKQVRA